jgi:hypothetical protein
LPAWMGLMVTAGGRPSVPVVNMAGQSIGIVLFQVKGQTLNFADPGCPILPLQDEPPAAAGAGRPGQIPAAAPWAEGSPPPAAGGVRTVPVALLTDSLDWSEPPPRG